MMMMLFIAFIAAMVVYFKAETKSIKRKEYECWGAE